MDITINQGADYYLSLTLTGASSAPYNLTGCSVSGQIRKSHADPLLAAFVPTFTSTTGGVVAMNIPHSVTKNLPIYGSLQYDILLTRSDSSIIKLVEGSVFVDPVITQ